MKRIAFSALAALALAAPAQAIVGGPFDNNQFYGHSLGGTFQGTLTATNKKNGQNFSGVLFFSTATDSIDAGASYMGNGGYVAGFYEGRISVANVTAALTGNSGEISGTIQPAVVGSGAKSVYGFFNAGVGKKYPNITFKGNAELAIADYTTSNPADDHRLKGRVRGIKTSQNASFFVWTPTR